MDDLINKALLMQLAESDKALVFYNGHTYRIIGTATTTTITDNGKPKCH